MRQSAAPGKIKAKLKDSAYVVEHAETGLTFSLCGSKPALKSPDTGSFFPGTRAGRLGACTRVVTLLQPEAGYEVVRRDA